MPIILRKDVDWKETESTLTIKVHSKRISTAKIDFLYTTHYVKVSYEQYLFEAFLLHPVNPKRSSCVVTETFIIFELFKNEPQIWGELERKFDSKSEKLALKLKCIEEHHEMVKQQAKKVAEIKGKLKHVSVREQISIDSVQRKGIEEIKKAEKEAALLEMSFKKSVENENEIAPLEAAANDENAPIRNTQAVEILFSHRDFSTPCRESRLAEEDEWLQKQAAARRSCGFMSEDLRPEEKNPNFLLGKGLQFVKNRNFFAAISAFSFGIKISPAFVDLYIARSGAHEACGNFTKTVEDCSTALDLLKPEVPANLQERALCMGRRGIALSKLGMKKQAIGELESALQLVRNQEFQNVLESLSQGGSSDSDST